MRITSLTLPEELVTRLDSFAAGNGRSRSNAAVVCLEAALNADDALRRQAQENFMKLQTPGCADSPARGGERDGLSNRPLPAEGVLFRRPPTPAGSVEAGTPPDSADYPLSKPPGPAMSEAEMKRIENENSRQMRESITQTHATAVRHANEQSAEARRNVEVGIAKPKEHE